MADLLVAAGKFLATVVVFSFAVGVQAKAPVQANRFVDHTCGVDPNRTLFRSKTREITTLFFANAAPSSEVALKDLLGEAFNAADRKKHVADYLNKSFRAVRSVEEVVAAIGDKSVAGKLKWMAGEISPEELAAESDADSAKTLNDVEKQLLKDKLKAKDVRLYLLLRAGPIRWARWKIANAQKGVRLVALDDAQSREKLQEYMTLLEERTKALFAAAPGSGLVTSQVTQLTENCTADLFAGRRERSQEFKDIVAKAKKPAMKIMIEDYRKWIEEGVDLLNNRDDMIARAILGQKGEGLIVVSRIHGPGVTDRLMNSCK